MTPVVEEAYRKGIPVILIDRKILSDKYTAYIGADNYEIGRAVGNYIAQACGEKGMWWSLQGWEVRPLRWSVIRDYGSHQ